MTEPTPEWVEERRRQLKDILGMLESASRKKMDIDSFNSRLMIQKSIYLLGAMGYAPVKSYGFGSYLRGPYSPELAKDYYSIDLEDIPRSNPRLTIPKKMLSPVVFGISKGVLFLEATTSLHSTTKNNPKSYKEEIISHVRAIKPHTNFYLEEAWEFLMENGLISRKYI